MPPKGRKKNKGPPEKQYTLLTQEDVKTREQKYTARLADLRVCLRFIDDALEQIVQLNNMQLEIDKWEDYITCNPLPKAYIPPEIRIFFEKLNFFQRDSVEANIDWVLAINDRSILSQNIFREDLTKPTLEEKIKPEFGIEYNKYINHSLNVIKRIEYFLVNDTEVAKCSASILEDIKSLKRTVMDHIAEFFDHYTYRILCSEVAYMKDVDAIATEYYFQGDNFDFQIWALKNVPIRFSHLDEPRIIADIHALHLTLHIPSTMLYENLAIRAVRMNYDHISEKAKSFYQHITVPTDELAAGIQDLYQSLLHEWLAQLKLQSALRREMVQKRLDYEEQMRLYEEQEAKKAKGNQKQDEDDKKPKAPKILKPTKVPPIIGPNMFPDVYDDFLVEEQKEYESFINTVYNPESLELDSDEINMKCFLMLGGIYQLQYVQKPKHCDFNLEGFNMTWNKNESRLVVDHDMYIPTSARFHSRRTTRLMSQMSISRMGNIKQMPEPKSSTDPECPWFVLTFTLPEYLCFWGEPIACHFETITKVIEEAVEEVVVEEKKKKRKVRDVVPIAPVITQTDEEIAEEARKRMEYFPYLMPYEGDTRTSILKRDRGLARLSKGNYYRPSLSLRLSLGGDPRQAREIDGTLNIDDFSLKILLQKANIRHLERHCLPRIISSFKFPKEIHEEEMEAVRNKSKGKGGTLIRKQATADVVTEKTTYRNFAYNENQNNPERVFTIFERQENVRIIKPIYEDHQLKLPVEPEKFSELLQILNNIKEKYRSRIRQTLDLRPFKPKVKLVNKRLRQLKKKENRVEDKRISTKIQALEDEHTKSLTNDEIAKPSKHFQAPPVVAIQEAKTATYDHWTTRHIIQSQFNREKRTMTIQTDRLGFIGFAFKRYEHFPFKYWCLQPSEDDPENEVVFTLETQYVRCVLYCTPHGIRGHVTEATKTYVRNPKMYLVIKEPIKDYKEFKKLFKEKFLNIFAEHDACYYIENGYFSEKHLATEMHTYCCMAVHSTEIKFIFSQWNRLAKRRDIVLKFVQYKDLPENLVEIRITPEEAFFVEVTELCSDDLEVIKLQYTTTWRNIGSYTDLHHVISSMYPAATESRCKNPKLISCIRDLLNEIRPLSYS